MITAIELLGALLSNASVLKSATHEGGASSLVI